MIFFKWYKNETYPLYNYRSFGWTCSEPVEITLNEVAFIVDLTSNINKPVLSLFPFHARSA